MTALLLRVRPRLVSWPRPRITREFQMRAGWRWSCWTVGLIVHRYTFSSAVIVCALPLRIEFWTVKEQVSEPIAGDPAVG